MSKIQDIITSYANKPVNWTTGDNICTALFSDLIEHTTKHARPVLDELEWKKRASKGWLSVVAHATKLGGMAKLQSATMQAFSPGYKRAPPNTQWQAGDVIIVTGTWTTKHNEIEQIYSSESAPSSWLFVADNNGLYYHMEQGTREVISSNITVVEHYTLDN